MASDVRQTLDQFRRTVDSFFDNAYGAPAERSNVRDRDFIFSPAVENAWTKDALHLRAIVPGVTQDDVRVTVHNNQLVIEGERKVPDGFDRNAFTRLAYGRFYTAVNLPNGLDLDKLTCRMRNGILDISVPVAETSKPRQIPIETFEHKSLNA